MSSPVPIFGRRWLRTRLNRDVPTGAPLHARAASRRRVDDVPPAFRRAIDYEVGLAVTIVVRRHRDVRAGAPLSARPGSRRRVDDVPPAFRRPVDYDVGLAVTIVVSRHRNVAADTPLRG